MKKNKAKKDVQDTIEACIWVLPNWFRRKYPKLWKRILTVVVALAIILVIVVRIIIAAISHYPVFKKNILGIETQKPPTNSESIPIPLQTEHPIQKRLDDDRVENKCSGAIFNPILDFEAIGGERFYYENEKDLEVSARNTPNYQAAVKTQWHCKMPLIVQLRFYPVSGKSLGVFLEYENVFITLLGDGDKKTLKVQENKFGIRSRWEPVLEEELTNTIGNNEEVILTIKAKEVDKAVEVKIEVWHSKFQNKEEYSAKFIPNVNFGVKQPRRFRIGINDSFYKGEGSVVKFDTFSVMEIDW